MDWKSFLEYALIGVMIGLAVCLLVALISHIIANVRGYREINGKIGDTRGKTLVCQLEDMEADLSREHNKILQQIDRIYDDQRKLADTFSSLNEVLLLLQKVEESHYKTLFDRQREINNLLYDTNMTCKRWNCLDSICEQQNATLQIYEGLLSDECIKN